MSGLDIEALFDEHYDALYRYLARLTGDADLAADAAQEAFVRLVERRPEGNGSEIRGWLYRVSTNVVRDHARIRRRRMQILQEAPDRTPLGDAPPGPERVLEVTDTRALVRSALDALSLRDRTILLMREQGFAHHEIADAVGTTTKSVGSLIARALKKLSVELAMKPGVKE